MKVQTVLARAAGVMIGAVVLGWGSGLWGAPMVTVATGVYDENGVQPNTVNVNAAGAAAFQAALNVGFPAGRGGVITFDDVPVGGGGSELVVSFAGGSKTLRIGHGGSSDGFAVHDVVGASRTPISGTRMLLASDLLHGDGHKNDWVFQFHPVQGPEENERVVRVGFTILGRNGTGYVIEKVQAIFDDLSTAEIFNINYAGRGTADTFVEFVAPPGRYIQTVRIENLGWDHTSLDDLGFLTESFPLQLPDLVPYSGDYLRVVKRYAEVMMEHGRDVYGSGVLPGGGNRKSGLFLSALDRVGPGGAALIADRIPAAPAGVREIDRAIHRHRTDPQRRLYGSNLGQNQAFLVMLKELSEYLGEPEFREAADQNLEWMFRNARSGVNGDVTVPTGLLAWGEHTSWDVVNDRAATGFYTGHLVHEFVERFDLWDRVFALAPEDAADYAAGIWHWQINNKTTGNYDRHAFYDGVYGFSDEFDFPRHGSFYIHTWGAALAHAEDEASRNFFRHAIDIVLTRLENKKAGKLAAHGPGHDFIHMSANPRDDDLWTVNQTLDLTLAVHLAAEKIDREGVDPLAARLLALARGEDRTFLEQPHDPSGVGFVISRVISTLQITGYSAAWGLAYGAESLTHVLGTQMVERARQLERSKRPEDVGRVGQFKALALAAADLYLTSSPDLNGNGDLEDEQIWALELGKVIELLLGAYDFSGDVRYLKRARYFGDMAVEVFWGPYGLPRASTDTGHYEAIAGTGELGVALLRLHRTLMNSLLPSRYTRLVWVDEETLALDVLTVPGARYRLWQSDDLQVWEVHTEMDAEATELRFVVPKTGAERKFYRVTAIPNL